MTDLLLNKTKLAQAVGHVKTLHELVQQRSDALGLAIVLSNDYSCCKEVSTLKGTEADGRAMEKACEQLGFAVHRQHNDVTQARVVSLLEEANKMEYPTSYKRLIFVFCGHGEEGGIIVTSEQKKILTAEIISTLSQDKLKTMPRLFFFDVCRGKENDTGIILPVPRGGNTMRTVRVPKAESNYLVAYSTINGYRSFELPKESGYKEGGIWMQHVAAKLASANMSISDLLTSVNGEMRELFDKHKEMEYVQQPEMILRLNDTVNLVKEASKYYCVMYHIIPFTCTVKNV